MGCISGSVNVAQSEHIHEPAYRSKEEGLRRYKDNSDVANVYHLLRPDALAVEHLARRAFLTFSSSRIFLLSSLFSSRVSGEAYARSLLLGALVLTRS